MHHYFSYPHQDPTVDPHSHRNILQCVCTAKWARITHLLTRSLTLPMYWFVCRWSNVNELGFLESYSIPLSDIGWIPSHTTSIAAIPLWNSSGKDSSFMHCMLSFSPKRLREETAHKNLTEFSWLSQAGLQLFINPGARTELNFVQSPPLAFPMNPRLYFTVSLFLAGSLVPLLAIPLHSTGTQSVDLCVSILRSGTIYSVSGDIENKPPVELWYKDDEYDTTSFPIDVGLFPRSKRLKRTATEAKQRKQSMRAQITHNQVNNTAKKDSLQKKANELPSYLHRTPCQFFPSSTVLIDRDHRDHKYGKPRKPSYTKKTTKKGTVHIMGGFRKQGQCWKGCSNRVAPT